MAPKGTPPKSQASGTFHLPPPPSKNPAPTKSAATTGDLPAWKCTGPSTAKAAKPSYLQVSQVQGKGAGKQATRPFEEMAVERFRSSVDSYVEGKLQEIAKAGDAEASVILQKMQQNSMLASKRRINFCLMQRHSRKQHKQQHQHHQCHAPLRVWMLLPRQRNHNQWPQGHMKPSQQTYQHLLLQAVQRRMCSQIAQEAILIPCALLWNKC